MNNSLHNQKYYIGIILCVLLLIMLFIHTAKDVIDSHVYFDNKINIEADVISYHLNETLRPNAPENKAQIKLHLQSFIENTQFHGITLNINGQLIKALET